MGKDIIEKIPAMTLRKHMGELFNRVKFRNEVLLVERSGEPLVAIISVNALKKIEDITNKNTENIVLKKEFFKKKSLFSLQGSAQLLGDLEEGSREITKQFEKSLKNTANQL